MISVALHPPTMQKKVANGNTQRRDAELMTRAVKCQLPGGKIANQSDAKTGEEGGREMGDNGFFQDI